jgi:hypothetical protein
LPLKRIVGTIGDGIVNLANFNWMNYWTTHSCKWLFYRINYIG